MCAQEFIIIHSITILSLTSLFLLSPDFAHEKLVEQEAQGEEDHALDEGGDEHPAEAVYGEWVLIGINAIATEDLDLYVHAGQFHQPIPKVELGED